MAKVTIIFGVILIAIGLAGYFGSNMASMTALIPTWIGIALAICGALSFKDKLRPIFMHIAVLIGLVGAIGAGMRISPAYQTMQEEDAPLAFYSITSTTVLLVVFVVLCIVSFVKARTQTTGGATTE